MSAVMPSPSRHSGLSEHDMNRTEEQQDIVQPRVRSSPRKSVARISEVAGATAAVGFSIGVVAGPAMELTPRKKARRSMQPRKSILRGYQTENLSHLAASMSMHPQGEHTIAIKPKGRVSFAPNAHVREFNQPPPRVSLPAGVFKRQAGVAFSTSTPAAATAPRSSMHARRSSIQTADGVQMARFVGEGEALGEASMEMDGDTASEATDSSDDEAPAADTQAGGAKAKGPFTGQGQRFSFGGATRRSVGLHSPARAPVKAVADGPLEPYDDDDEDADAEGEMDMDITQVVYGGIVNRRISTAASEVSEGNSGSFAINEEQTLDYTVAIGGVLPSAPPVHAVNSRLSIGYSVPASPRSATQRIYPGQPTESEMTEAMEETQVFGGIIGPDDTVSSAGNGEEVAGGGREKTMTFSFNPAGTGGGDEDGMEMTVAIGGILSDHANIVNSHTLNAAGRRSIAPRSPARPTGNTPSFARPTVSSATKSKTAEKRNVFAPSPSPSPTKVRSPKKSGIQTAAEVAKRLEFTPSSVSPAKGRKRGHSASFAHADADDLGASQAKRQALVVQNVFISPVKLSEPTAAARSGGTPRRSLGLGPPAKAAIYPAKSPAKSPMLRRMLNQQLDEDDEAEVDNIAGHGEFAPPTITLGAFLEMAGVQFIEALPAMRRRSSVGRGVLAQSHAGDREFDLSDYSAAQVQTVFLNMYNWAINKMKTDISECAEQLAQTEADCLLHNPPVIREYLSEDDEEKKIFEMTFKSYKTNTQLRARELWYDWKMGILDRMRPDVEDVLEGMKQDQARLDDMQDQTTALLPELRARHEALKAELERERAVVAEMTECDQDELKALREAISEQGQQITVFSNELSEATAVLEKLEINLGELKAKKAHAQGAINLARSMCDQFTKSDVLRLQEEYESLQALHLWRPTQMASNALELTYDSEIKLAFAARDYVPDVRTATVSLLPKDDSRQGGRSTSRALYAPTEGLFKVFESAVMVLAQDRSTKNLNLFVQRAGQLWSAVQRIRQELRLLHLHYPLSYNTTSDGQFEVSASAMFPAQRSKVAIVFRFERQMLMRWPESAAEVDVRVEAIYGLSDTKALTEVAKRIVAMAHAEGYLGYLLQTCVDVAAE